MREQEKEKKLGVNTLFATVELLAWKNSKRVLSRKNYTNTLQVIQWIVFVS